MNGNFSSEEGGFCADRSFEGEDSTKRTASTEQQGDVKSALFRRKILFLGPAWPYRGGIATIIERLATVFADRGFDARVFTFRVQYPAWLFPGKSQFRDEPPPDGLDIRRVINTVNPLNWVRTGLRVARERPDLVVLKYWTPFMAPCFGVIARVARRVAARRGHTIRFVVQLDNIIPHERHWWDAPLTRFFVRSMDGFVAMSTAVARDLTEFLPAEKSGSECNLEQGRGRNQERGRERRVVLSPHPMFDHFGEKLPRTEACEHLGLDPTRQYSMFFGLVRDYKGLDLLLEAWKKQKTHAAETDAAAPRTLLVVGEFYDDPAHYDPARVGLSGEDVIVRAGFVPDNEVRLWFSVADVLILPYRSATQSGVTQIAYHFDVPMIVTDVGGLPEIVRDGVVGLVAQPTVDALQKAIEKIFQPGETDTTLDRLRGNFANEKQRFSWNAAAQALLDAADF